jgi:SNF2 family DNA or RNA helicase
LLRAAVRLGFRSSAGPFRSFARIHVEPRAYQLVPLLMALKQNPVRLLIADDVGIGKTVEALLIARELLDRGEITSLAVLCPHNWRSSGKQNCATNSTSKRILCLPAPPPA